MELAMAEAAHSRAATTTDYDVVRRTIEFISGSWRDQPSLDEIAANAGLPPLALQRLFARWAGLTPKAFLQAVTLDHARGLLSQSASILEASYELGLSGPGRLHDLFVTHEAMTPGAFKARGEGSSFVTVSSRHRSARPCCWSATAVSPASPSPIPARKPPASPTCSAGGRAPPTSPMTLRPPKVRIASSIRTRGGRTGRCASC